MSQIVRFEPGGLEACERHQYFFLPVFCGLHGESLRDSSASSCLPDLDADLQVALKELRIDVGFRPGTQRPRGEPSIAGRPSIAAQFAPMPAAVATAELSARVVFAQARTSVWVVRARSIRGASQGSAVAVSPRHLLTTCHVVDGAVAIDITQGTEQHAAAVTHLDATSDRCILEVSSPTLRPIRGVRRAAALEVGERVLTIGAPSGLELTLGDGLLSSKRVHSGVEVLQTSAPLSPGSSGGALLDARGNLIGIIAFYIQGGQALGFAIAADSFWRPR